MYVTTLNLTFKGHFIVIRKQNSQVREVTLLPQNPAKII